MQAFEPPERHVRTEGIEIDTSTLADRVGACVVALDPIVQALKVHVLAAERIHTDDTTLPVLAKMNRHSPDSRRLKTNLHLLVVIGKPGSPRTVWRRV
jgi:hypothetical protein